ncbi:FAD-dependent oxidoreductase [Paracoccus aminophilus]|nr:FAD-dependent oxidoreductase [Paracoccus aminophilus]
MSDKSFSFDGRRIEIRSGQSIAAALTEAGIRSFRETAKGENRSIFCGMGVCQDCLVTVDGQPNQRACMTPAKPGAAVQTQIALPELGETRATPPVAEARHLAPDVLIIGGGAAGLSAAITARVSGASVVLLDERKVAGGQFFKQSAEGPALDPQQAAGADLIARARASGAEIISEAEVWGGFEGLFFIAAQNGTPLLLRPKTAIIATGAYERPIVVPGWTLPGVMTSGAAQTLWRSYRTLPGKRIAICGSGPLNLQVAQELAQGGAEIVLIAEAGIAPWSSPAQALALAAADPGLTLKGLRMLAGLKRRGVPIHYGARLTRIDPLAEGLEVTVTTANGRETAQVDAVLMNAGFDPQNELLRLLGAEMRYDAARGHLCCQRDAQGQTSVAGLYAIGDCAGLGGAPAAMVEGRIAGRAAAQAAGHSASDSAADQRALAQHRRFQAKLWAFHDIAPPPVATLPDETILCRCEEIRLGQIRAEMASTAHPHAGNMKRATRVGMGRCQGRYCAATMARMVAETTGQPVGDRSYFAPRVPVKPVAIATILAAEKALNDAS